MTVYAETVLERVLLAIIEAHPGDGVCGPAQERLEMALKALLGTSVARSHAFSNALVQMQRERHRDICDAELTALAVGSNMPPAAVRSVRDLAETAARDAFGLLRPAEAQKVIELLCRQYRFNATERDPTREAMQDEAVLRIVEELSERDIFVNA